MKVLNCNGNVILNRSILTDAKHREFVRNQKRSYRIASDIIERTFGPKGDTKPHRL